MKKITILNGTFFLVLWNALFAHDVTPANVDAFLKPYFGIQKALATDNLEKAKKAAGHFEAAIQASEAGHTEALQAFLPSVKSIVETDSIQAARTAFLKLSETLQPLVEKVGTTGASDVYVAFCPMAFNNQGGAWMQNNKTIANPYYGSTMLRCGSVKKQLAAGNGHDHGSHVHGEHGH